MEEIWKDVPDYQGLYSISDLGRVKSSYYNKILKPSYDRYGYARFSATKNKKQKTLRVHRLVMELFSPENKLPQVNHIDGDKTNNKLNNLEWATDSENKIHAYSKGLMPKGNQFTGKLRRNLKRYN